MSLLRALNRILDAMLQKLLAAAFAGMIITVFMQVAARNILQEPLIWSLDVAQLLFAWCIFLGAALALRWGEHYTLELVPAHWRVVTSLIAVFAHCASAVVVGVLFFNGWIFADMGFSRFAPAIGISEFWFFLPIPLSGGVMILFLAEMIPDDLRRITEDFGRASR